MDHALLWRFMDQLQFQCGVVRESGAQLDAALSARRDRAAFIHIQALLGGAANIAKCLFTLGGRRPEARAELRKRLSVRDDALVRLTLIRDGFEHFDSRLEEWWTKSSDHSYQDLIVASPISAISGPDEDVDRFRVYDPTSGALYFWGLHLNLQELREEVGALSARIGPAIDALY